MGAATVSVSVYIDGGTTAQARQSRDGAHRWLELGQTTGSVAVFFDRAGLDRLRRALAELDNRMPAPVKAAA